MTWDPQPHSGIIENEAGQGLLPKSQLSQLIKFPYNTLYWPLSDSISRGHLWQRETLQGKQE